MNTSFAIPEILRRKTVRGIVEGRALRDEDRLGGKLARQRSMAEAGVAVPPFFALSTELFDAATAAIRPTMQFLVEAIDFGDPRSIASAARAMQALFEGLVISPEVERAILAAFDRHFAPDALVAVRASTVGKRDGEGEDSASNPFAGISETFLYVPRARLLERVRLCWASGFGQEALLYRHAQGMDLLGASVAVAVQEMVIGERSFVLFTCDPKTAAREAVVVAGYGAGEGVVQERVGVDHYFVHGSTGTVRREIGDKAERMVLDRTRGEGLQIDTVPEELRAQPCLSDEELQAIVELGRRIEKIFGCPQDIEGSITPAGAIRILQARPIAIDYRRLHVFTNANVTESFPGVTTALTYTFARGFYRVIFRDCYRKLGMRDIDAEHDVLDRMIAFVRGRVYYDLNAFYHLHSRSPLFPVFRAHWEKMMGFRASYQTQEGSFVARTLAATGDAVSLVSAASVAAARYATHDRAMAHFHAWWEGLMADRRGRTFDEVDPLVLVGDFQHVMRAVGEQWGVTLLNDTYLPVLYGYTERLIAEWLPDAPASLLSDLLCGDDGLLSVEIVRSAVRLAERVRGDQVLLEAFGSLSAEELWAKIASDALDPAFCASVREHLHRYGDRGLQELKMEQPNLRHTPVALIRTLQGYAATDVSVEGMRTRELALRAAAERVLDESLKGPRRAVLGYLLQTTRRLIRHRENSRYCRSELFGYAKSVFRALGRRLVEASVLRSEEDVYDLTQDEIFGWVDGTGVTSDLQLLAELRREERSRNEQVETPMELTTLGAVNANTLERKVAIADGALCGLGSSSGVVRGRARVVLDPNEVSSLAKDTILVARETDPGWLFLMLNARGIVVERGSMLSHTAITGRKFGIPTVVSVPSATTRIPDGAEIEIDGATGVVTVLSPGGSA